MDCEIERAGGASCRALACAPLRSDTEDCFLGGKEGPPRRTCSVAVRLSISHLHTNRGTPPFHHPPGQKPVLRSLALPGNPQIWKVKKASVFEFPKASMFAVDSWAGVYRVVEAGFFFRCRTRSTRFALLRQACSPRGTSVPSSI